MSYHAVFFTIATWALICAAIAGVAPLFGFSGLAPTSWLIAKILFVSFALYALPVLLIGLSGNGRPAPQRHRKARA